MIFCFFKKSFKKQGFKSLKKSRFYAFCRFFAIFGAILRIFRNFRRAPRDTRHTRARAKIKARFSTATLRKIAFQGTLIRTPLC